MKRSRHAILGCRFSGSAKSRAAVYTRDFIGFGNYPAHYSGLTARQFDIYLSIESVVLSHLGYDIPVPVHTVLQRGLDVAVDYFCGDWSKSDSDGRKALDKSRTRSRLTWFGPFSNGLLMGLLAEKWKDVERICDWVDASLLGEYLDEKFDIEICDIYKSVAASLRSAPMPGLDKIEKKLSKCRSQRPKLLFQVWNSARRRDQTAFSDCIIQSLEHFAATFGHGPIPVDWVALPQSVVVLAARRFGMRLPHLSPKLEALLLSPESIKE
jgi:hypothetical protein